ncbi:MAG TPA: pyruvate kinase [Saprospiraceae bacterium]|jgi:pyruvate kinase|nr:MAG: pyruvate kinase [Candidatus Parvibacillus calidus]MBX2938368.1 pyruvate kinase [Saprospiraceae bacterium]MBX7180066.1 pyruvate kinase [Saprospiraceae bacterium]MCB0590965.1 pyruvate kinase [Saprospiraceae bacterium]MCC7149344.1 pyruvate kinase [Saprospiraceae bacterium]
MADRSFQNTKIVATLGPASDSYETMVELVKAGVDVFRINMSHGSHEVAARQIETISKLNKDYKINVGILADLQGPKLRVGQIENNVMELNAGDILTFVNEKCVGNAEKIYMSYKNFAADVEVGEKVLIDDGKVGLEVIETNNVDTVRLKVLYGKELSSNKGVNLPDTLVSLPAMTEKDLNDLEFLMTQPVNWIALSFVRGPKEVKALKDKIKQHKHHALVIAKIEKPQAVEKIEKIVKATDGIMIARGDLGVEMPIEKLPGIQKRIIALCVQFGKPVIVATQMMDSMITNPSPTRAEVTDVANAVLEGTDAVMLSGETSVGAYPIETVLAMNRIIAEAEKNYPKNHIRPYPSRKSETFMSDVVCFNAAKTAEELGASAIIGMTAMGYTGFKISSYRSPAEIFIFSDRKEIAGMLNLVWGVRCFHYDGFNSTDETITEVLQILKSKGRVRSGETVVFVGSMPLKSKGMTNMMKVALVE